MTYAAMSELINDKKVFSLQEVTLSIRKTISERYQSSFWVKAEMNKLNHYALSGHCYPELVQKENGKVVAQLKGILWQNDFQRINERFLSILKEPVKDGIKILFCARISFDPTYGLCLGILDIDPSFSLGELEREKNESIQKLNTEGIFDRNKQLALALLPQRIAVISIETSKGYSDYLKMINENPWGYKFFNFLFPSLLQGDKSVSTIINQLKRIRKVSHHFDAVAIIRGGGGDVGLSSFNNYALAREIALFPIPVITGIGHSTNETVAEMVSFKNAITPTELADFLIQKFHNFSVPVNKAKDVIVERSRRILIDEALRLRNTMKYFQSVTNNQLLKNQSAVQELTNSLVQNSRFLVKQELHAHRLLIQNLKKYSAIIFQNRSGQIADVVSQFRKHTAMMIIAQSHSLEHLQKHVDILNPVNILKRGFTITLHNGKAIKHYTEIQPGEVVTTILAEGQITSTVNDSKESA